MSSAQKQLDLHVKDLLACDRCPAMHKPVISGGPVMSKVLLVGQAPGVKEPALKRPFAYTAGKTLFRWFNEATGISETQFRASVYIAAVCRCYPGKNPKGGDRVPDKTEIGNCASWLEAEIQILKPELVIPVGKLAIQQFIDLRKLVDVIGQQFTVKQGDSSFDLIPLPHPSGASTWHQTNPGKKLLNQALSLVAGHKAFKQLLD